MRNGGERTLVLATEVDKAGRVLIKVQDSGPGIAANQVDEIFKSFYTTKPDGMGLGLAICKTIVEAHGGVLTAVPGDHVGMTFTVDLPLTARRQSPSINGNPASEPRDVSTMPGTAEPPGQRRAEAGRSST
jgi:signal transduction histidine kinase